MANNYTQFSEQISDITPDEETWIKSFLCEECPDKEDESREYEQWCKERKLNDGDDPDWYPGFQWEISGGDLWMYCEEGCNPDYLVSFVQLFLQKFRPDYVFTATGADFCSKMRIGEFGGWWVAVSAHKVLWGSCHDSARRDARKLKRELEKEEAR